MSKQSNNWRQLAQEIGGHYVKGREEGLLGLFWIPLENSYSDRVELLYKDKWTITLDWYKSLGLDETEYFTRMRAPYSLKDNFSFSISHQPLLGRVFGIHKKSIPIGVEEFDKKYFVKGNNQSKLIDLFEDRTLRILLDSQASLDFEANIENENLQGELCYEADDVITDISRLKSIFVLFKLTLDGLQRIGSAQ